MRARGRSFLRGELARRRPPTRCRAWPSGKLALFYVVNEMGERFLSLLSAQLSGRAECGMALQHLRMRPISKRAPAPSYFPHAP
eukprot:365976-Chlamydomonas_euryale.AAC.12